MSNIPESLTSCMDPSSMSLKDYVSNTADLADATGMNDKCVKAAQTEATAASVSASASVPFANVSAQASFQNSQTAMAEAGCGQFALNVQNQMQHMKNINCKIKDTNNSVSSEQVSGNSITFRTLPLTPDEQANKAKLEKQLIELQSLTLTLVSNPNIKPDTLETLLTLNKQSQDTTKSLLQSYERNININNANIVQGIVARQASSISLSTNDIDEIVVSQKAIAKTTAENKLAQELGVAALTPQSKSIINSNIDSSAIFTSQNVTKTINDIKMTQKSSNSLELSAPGNINFTNSNISQNIVADMVTKALINNSFQAGTQIANSFIAEATASIAIDGKSEGANALIEELGKANAAAIAAAKVSPVGGGIFAAIVGIFFILAFVKLMSGGGSSGGGSSGGGTVVTLGSIIISIISSVIGVLMLLGIIGKNGKGDHILGIILVVIGGLGLLFAFISKIRYIISSFLMYKSYKADRASKKVSRLDLPVAQVVTQK